MCVWQVAGQDLLCGRSFRNLGMLYCDHRHVKHAVCTRYIKAVLQLRSTFLAIQNCHVPLTCKFKCNCSKPFYSLAPYMAVRCGHLQLQQSACSANLRICSSFSCGEICRVNLRRPVDSLPEELAVTCWQAPWWRWVVSFRTALLHADSASICSLVLHDSIALI